MAGSMMGGQPSSCFRRRQQPDGQGLHPHQRAQRRPRTVTLDPTFVRIDDEVDSQPFAGRRPATARSSSSSSSVAGPGRLAASPSPMSAGSPRSPVEVTGARTGYRGGAPRPPRRRNRRCATWATPVPADVQAPRVGAEGNMDGEDGDAGEAELDVLRRRVNRSSTAPAAMQHRPPQWADPNACAALTELVLDDRRRGRSGEGAAAPSGAPALVANLIAPFLRFDAPLTGMLYVFGGRNQKSPAMSTVEMFDHWHGHWVQCPPLPAPRVSATAAALPDGRMLIIGGYNEKGMMEGLLASCELYDPCAREWKQGGAAPMGRARWGHGCAALCGKVYVIGGCSLIPHAQPAVGSMETLRSCEVYSPEEDAWTPIASLSTARSGARAVAVGAKYLAAIGGCDDIFGREEHLRSVELFDPSVGLWATLRRRLAFPRPIAAAVALPEGAAPAAAPRASGRAAAEAAGHIFVFGGAAALASVEVYSVIPPKDEEDTEDESGEPSEEAPELLGGPYAQGLPDMPHGRMGCQAAIVDLPAAGGPGYPQADQRSVAIVGGEIWESAGRAAVPKRADFASVPVFDISSGTWRSDVVVPHMSMARTAVALCVGLGHAWRPQAD